MSALTVRKLHAWLVPVSPSWRKHLKIDYWNPHLIFGTTGVSYEGPKTNSDGKKNDCDTNQRDSRSTEKDFGGTEKDIVGATELEALPMAHRRQYYCDTRVTHRTLLPDGGAKISLVKRASLHRVRYAWLYDFAVSVRTLNYRLCDLGMPIYRPSTREKLKSTYSLCSPLSNVDFWTN